VTDDLELAASSPSDPDHDRQTAVPDRWLVPFDLSAAPAWRVHVSHPNQVTQTLALVCYHSIMDGWSEAVLLNDLGRAYVARRSGAAPEWTGPAGQVWELAAQWTRNAGEPSTRATNISFWATELAHVEPLHASLSPGIADPNGPGTGSPIGSRWLRVTDRDEQSDLQSLLLAAWAAALRRLFGRQAGGGGGGGGGFAARDRVDADAVGCCVELLPVVPPVVDTIRRAAERVAAARRRTLEHRWITLSDILAAGVGRRPGRTIQSVLVVQAPPPHVNLDSAHKARRIGLRHLARSTRLRSRLGPGRARPTFVWSGFGAPSGTTRRMSRVPWNFGGGLLIVRPR